MSSSTQPGRAAGQRAAPAHGARPLAVGSIQLPWAHPSTTNRSCRARPAASRQTTRAPGTCSPVERASVTPRPVLWGGGSWVSHLRCGRDCCFGVSLSLLSRIPGSRGRRQHVGLAGEADQADPRGGRGGLFGLFREARARGEAGAAACEPGPRRAAQGCGWQRTSRRRRRTRCQTWNPPGPTSGVEFEPARAR